MNILKAAGWFILATPPLLFLGIAAIVAYAYGKSALNILKAVGASIVATPLLVFLVMAAITAYAKFKLLTGTPASDDFVQSIGAKLGFAFVGTAEIGLPVLFIAFFILFSRRPNAAPPNP